MNGSGSLVSVREKYGVLTAAHVWKKLKNFHNIQLLIEDIHSKIFVELNEYNIRAWLPDRNPINNTKDICFLQILNPNIISTLKSKCTFYPLIPQTLLTIHSPRCKAYGDFEGTVILSTTKRKRELEFIRRKVSTSELVKKITIDAPEVADKDVR